MDALFAMYPEADRACQNPAHFFYGTDKRGEVLNPKALPVDILFSVLESDKLKGGSRARKIDAQTAGASFLRNIGEIPDCYNNTIEVRQKATNGQKIEYYEKLKKNKNDKPVD